MVKLDERLDPDYQHDPYSNPEARNLIRQEKKTGQDAGINAGIDQAQTYANDPANSTNASAESVERQEQDQGFYRPTNGTQRASFKDRALGFAKSKKGAATGIFGGFGIAGIIISAIFGNFTLLTNLQSNSNDTNDTRSALMDSRLAKWLDKKFSLTNSNGCSVTKYKCRAGKMPKVMLERMAQQGIVGVDADGNKAKITYRNGYAVENPTHYTITDPTAPGGSRTISAKDVSKEYKKNAAFRKSFKGAYNMRYRAWVGKNIRTLFYDKFNLKQTGGLASDENNLDPDNVDEKLDEKLNSSSSNLDDSAKKAKFSERFKTMLEKTGKKVTSSAGSISLAVGSTYCTVTGLPGFIAGTYRAIQLAQILILVQDVILSPAGKEKAGKMTPEAVSAIGDKLTQTVNGKSALDSAILLSALGINKSKTGASKYAPGYEAYKYSVVKGAGKIHSKNFCNKITSPEAVIAAQSGEAAIAAATGPETLGVTTAVWAGIKVGLRIAGTIGAVESAVWLADKIGFIDLITNQAFKLLSGFVGNFTDGARGLALGDALGMGIFAYFSTSGLASGAAVLKKSQVVAFNQAVEGVNDQYRQEDIATLSPFDTSSRYTFMGSLLSKFSLSGVFSTGPASSLSSIGSLVLSTPSTLLTPTVNAAADDQAQAAEARCDHADDFGVDDSIAVNPSGYPCVGIPAEYLGMSIDDVYGEVEDDVDEDSGNWKEDGDIAGIQADCADGDLEAIGGCTITNKKRAAQSIYQIDKQVSDVLDGSDDEAPGGVPSDGTGGSITVAEFNILHDGKGGANWPDRLQRSLQTLKDNNVQVAGLQEVRPSQNRALQNNDTYDMWPTDSNGGAGFSPNPVIWNRLQFTRIGQELLPIHYDNGKVVKQLVQVELRDNANPEKSFYVLSTHDPADARPPDGGVKGASGYIGNEQNAYDRYRNAKYYRDYLAELKQDGKPIIFVGDFNENYTGGGNQQPFRGKNDNLSYCVISRGGGVRNVWDIKENKDFRCPRDSNPQDAPIEHIYVGNVTGVDKVWTATKGIPNNGSDHPTVMATIKLPWGSTDSSAGGSSPSARFGNVEFPLKGNKSVVNDPGIFANGTTSLADHPYTAYDILANTGTEVIAFASGKVSYVSNDYCGGALVTIWNEKAKLGVSYMHMSDHVSIGTAVNVGDHVGTVGSAALGCGTPHLHIDVATDKIRQPCSRHGCKIQDHFRSIGKELYDTYQELPD